MIHVGRFSFPVCSWAASHISLVSPAKNRDRAWACARAAFVDAATLAGLVRAWDSMAENSHTLAEFGR